MKKGLFFFILVINTFLVYSQEDIHAGSRPFISEVGEVIEWLVGHLEEETELESVAVQLAEIQENPLNLNNADHDELKKLMFLSEQQIYNLLAYRINHRQFFSVYELQAIAGFDPVTIRRMLPFIQVGSFEKQKNIEPAQVFRFGRHKVLFRVGRMIEPRKGYESGVDSTGSSILSGRYLGSPERVLFRYRFEFHKRIRVGFSAEKDPGEILFQPRDDPELKKYLKDVGFQGFDAYSFHAVYKTTGVLRTLLAGDYQVFAGQGLTFGGGGSFGQALDYGGLKPSLSGIRPHSGSDENRYFRGIATELQTGYLRFLLFYSQNKMDATPPDSIQKGDDPLSFVLNYSGYHRTIRERTKKNTLQVFAAGVHLSYERPAFRVGISAVRTRFRFPVSIGSGIQAKIRPEFSGQEQVGVDYRIISGKFYFFGEWSVSGERILSMVHGITALLHAQVNVTLLYRNYPAAYQNIYSSGYSRRDPFNEKGFSVQFVLLPVRRLTVRGFFDYSVHPWLRYRVDRPSEGRDMTLFMEYQANKNIVVSGRVRYNYFQQNAKNPSWFKSIGSIRKNAYRIQLTSNLFSSWQLKNRIEWIYHREGNSNPTSGFLAMTGVRWHNSTECVVINLNYSFFDTWSYAERIYAYEPEVLYAFASTAYYDRGMKWAGLIRWRITEPLSLWLKLSRIWFRDQTTLGSGPETIQGNKKTEVKLQLMLRI